MRRIAAETGFSWKEISAFPGLATPVDSEVVELAKALSGGNSTIKVAFGTEAGLFQIAGIPTIVCGPGNIEQAHKPNEFIALDQVAQCEAMPRRMIRRAAAAVASLRARVVEHLGKAGQLTIQDFKTLTGLGRKQAIPLLEHLDREGVTKRQGDLRLPGPAAKLKA